MVQVRVPRAWQHRSLMCKRCTWSCCQLLHPCLHMSSSSARLLYAWQPLALLLASVASTAYLKPANGFIFLWPVSLWH